MTGRKKSRWLRLNPTSLALLGAIEAAPEGRIRQADLALAARLTGGSVTTTIRRLIRLGFIEVVEPGRWGATRSATRYRVLLPRKENTDA